MNYLVSSTYNINFYEYTDLELNFMKKSYDLGMRYPFKWYEFMNKIIGNPKITTFIDTTMIVNLLDLEVSQIKILFELLKEYLKLKLLKKILYKKEFIIVHFHTQKTTEVFKEKNLWIAIFSYFILKEYYPSLDIYLRGVICENNHKEIVDLIVNTNNSTYLLNSTKALSKNYDDAVSSFILYDFPRNLKIPENTFKIKFSFDVNTLLFNFEKLLEANQKRINAYL